MALLAAVASTPLALMACFRPVSGTLQRMPELLPPVLIAAVVVVALIAGGWVARLREPGG